MLSCYWLNRVRAEAGDVCTVHGGTRCRMRLHDAMLQAGLDLRAPVSVPNVLYLSVDDARRALAAVGLRVGKVQVVTGVYPVGVVIEQHPRANRMAARGSSIRVVIGSGNS
jgi:hypothetical protein